MLAKFSLFGRFVVPLAGIGLLLGVIVFWALWSLQQQALAAELNNRAQIVSTSLEQAGRRYGSLTEAIERVVEMTTNTVSLRHLHVIELNDRAVVASSSAEPFSMERAVRGELAWREGMHDFLVLPVKLDAEIREGTAMITQERAYTSPIWYSPEG